MADPSGKGAGDGGKVPWNMKIGKLKPGARETITDKKLATFVSGKQKKSRLQKEREEKERKEKQAEEEAKAIYQDFVQAFGTPSVDEGTTFLRGGVTGGASSAASAAGRPGVPRSGVGGAGSSVELPPALAGLMMGTPGEEYKLGARPGSKPAKPMSEMEKMVEEMRQRQEQKVSGVVPKPQAGRRPQGARQIDTFLEEIRGRVDTGVSHQLYSDQAPTSGSMDDGDPTSTNLYLGNLAPTVTEEALQDAFSPFGKVYSIKIMWPRTDEERARKRNCGFVSFWRRQDAVNAKRAMQDVEVENYRMSIGWGKPINKLANAVGVETKVETEDAPPPDVLDPGLPEPLQKLSVEAKASLQQLLPNLNPTKNAVAASLQALSGASNWMGTVAKLGIGRDLGGEGQNKSSSSSSSPRAASSKRFSGWSETPDGTKAKDKDKKDKEDDKDPSGPINGKPDGGDDKGDEAAKGSVEGRRGQSRSRSRSRSRSGSRSRSRSRSRSSSRSYSSRSYSRSRSRSRSGSRSRSRSRSSSRSRSRSSSRGRDGRRWRGGSRDRSSHRSRSGSREGPRRGDLKIEVEIPPEKDRRYMIDRTARYVSKDGQRFEQRLLDREANNPDFLFLFEYESKEGRYYRWKVYTLVMGDREDRWMKKPFQMTPDGPWWVPPDDPLTSSDSEDEEEKERLAEIARKKQALADRYKYTTGRELEKAREQDKTAQELSDEDFDKFSSLLRGLTNSRAKVKEAMGFALDHADASADVVGVLKESLLVPETPIHVKIARLYLLSDVLHNSSAPVKKASSYRTHLQKELPEIFDGLNKAYRNVEGRMTAKQIEDRILAILAAWDEWSIYPPLYMTGLEASFMRKSGDLEAKDLTGVEESSLDKEALAQKANQAGIFTDGLSALDLLKRLNYLNEFAKRKAARKLGAVAIGSGSASAEVDGSNGSISAEAAIAKGTNGADIGKEEGYDGEEDDEDVDGVPLDVPGLPAAATVAADPAVLRGSNNSSSSSSLQARGGPQSSGFSIFEGGVKGSVTAGAGQWKTVKTTNLEDSPSASSSDEEDVDGVPLDGPAAAAVGGVVSRSTSDIGRSNGKGLLSSPVSVGKSIGASAGSVKMSAEEGSEVHSTRGVYRDQEASGGITGGLKQQQGEEKARARVRARSRAGDSSSDDSDGEGDGPGKIDVWGDDDIESNNAMENADAGGDDGVKGGGVSGIGIGGAGGSGSGGVGGAVSDTASKMNEDEQRAERAFLRKVETEVLKLRDELEAKGMNEAGVQAQCEAKRGEMVESWERERKKKTLDREEGALQRERSTSSR